MFSTIAELRTWKVAQIVLLKLYGRPFRWPSWSDSGLGLEFRHGSELIQHHQQRLEIWMKWSINFKVPVNVRGLK